MTISDDQLVLVAGSAIEEREERLATGADELTTRRSSILEHEYFLLAASGAITTVGLTAIVLVWVGASDSTLIEEQVPYLISGGLLGVALAVIGALVFFAHWLTVLVREARSHEAARARDHRELIEAIRGLRGEATKEEGNGTARSAPRQRAVRRAPRRS